MLLQTTIQLHYGLLLNLVNPNYQSHLTIHSLKFRFRLQTGNSVLVELLLVHESALEITRRTGGTPLFTACKHGHKNVVDLLMKFKKNKQANMYYTFSEKQSSSSTTMKLYPVHASVINGDLKFVKCIVEDYDGIYKPKYSQIINELKQMAEKYHPQNSRLRDYLIQ